MAAGLGTRLHPLTGRIAKPMVPILNRPVMAHMIDLLWRHGVRQVAANLHYHPDDIRGYFGHGAALGVELRYNQEETLLGTAGGVGEFRDFFHDGTFVVVSGDGLTDVTLPAFVPAHKASGGVATMAVKQGADPSQYGVVVHDADLRVRGFQEKPAAGEAASDLCNCGIYAFEPAIFDYVPPGEFVDWAKSVFPVLLSENVPFHVWRLEGYWNDVGNIEQYRASTFDALLGRLKLRVPGRQHKPGVWVGEGACIHASARLEAPILIGAGCRIDAEAELIGPLILGDGCVVEEGAVVEGVINWDGVKAGRASRLAGSILGRDVIVHHEAVVHEGAVIADRAEVGAHALVPAMARIDARSVIQRDGGPAAPGASR